MLIKNLLVVGKVIDSSENNYNTSGVIHIVSTTHVEAVRYKAYVCLRGSEGLRGQERKNKKIYLH